MNLHVQFLTMGFMLACGLLIGFAFDVYRVLAGQLRLPRWTIPLLDLAFWALSTVFVFRVLFFSNYGQVRLFIFIGLFTGIVFYFTALSSAAIAFIRWLIRLFIGLYRILKRVVEIGVIAPIRMLYRLVAIVLKFLAIVAVFLYKVVLQLLYPVRFLTKTVWTFLKKRIHAPRWLTGMWDRVIRWFQR